MRTAEERYTEYNAFVSKQMEDGVYDTIPNCDSRILHDPSWPKETFALLVQQY